MKVSFIATVFNEEKTVEKLITSLDKQNQKPDEIVIVDGGSTDKTVEVLSKFKHVRVLRKKGNRSIGRNFAISKAKYPLIVISDAGCVLDKNFIREVTKKFVNKSIDVVAGYYKGIAETLFQEAVIPYVLVMPKNLNEETFLPASRSMAILKRVWKENGGFPEKYSYNEDYVFAKKLKKEGYKISFAKKAIVYWMPPDTLPKVFRMFYRFAYGDIEAGIVRPKVVLLFVRYFILATFILLGLFSSFVYFYLIFAFFVMYCIWAIAKNYENISQKKGVMFLPAIQLLSDIAVVMGSIKALIHKIFR